MARIISEPTEYRTSCLKCGDTIGYTEFDLSSEYADDPTGYSRGPEIGKYVTCPRCYNHVMVRYKKDYYDDPTY